MKNKKDNWLEAARQVLSDRIEVAEKAMKQAQEAAKGEEKSSAGDKYETSRAMSQLERDMNARQLDQALQERDVLKHLDIGQKSVVAKGAGIRTTDVYYFIALGLGKLEFEGEACIFLSPSSPLGMELMGKKAGEQISWNGQTIDILEVF